MCNNKNYFFSQEEKEELKKIKKMIPNQLEYEFLFMSLIKARNRILHYLILRDNLYGVENITEKGMQIAELLKEVYLKFDINSDVFLKSGAYDFYIKNLDEDEDEDEFFFNQTIYDGFLKKEKKNDH